MAGRILAFIRDEIGVTSIEYALLGAIIALPIIVGVTGIGAKLTGDLAEVSGALK